MVHPVFEEVARLREENHNRGKNRWHRTHPEESRKAKREWARKRTEEKRAELEAATCAAGCEEPVVAFYEIRLENVPLCRACLKAERAFQVLPFAAKERLMRSYMDVL